MEIKVVLEIDLSAGTKAFIQMLAGATVTTTDKPSATVTTTDKPSATKAAAPDNVVKMPASAAVAPKAAAPAPAAKPALPKPAAPAPAKPAAVAPKPSAPAKVAAPTPEDVAFDQLDEEAKREAIKTHITRHSKKGKTADIKALLTAYGVTKGSELTAEYLDSFFDSIEKFGNGTSVEDILASFGGEEESLA